MSKKDYYESLGIKKTASSDEIKKTYRNLAKKFHPDKNPDNKVAEDLFKEVSEAYEHLSNPEKKAYYDQFGHEKIQERQQNQRHSYRPQVRTGEHMVLVLTLTFEEIYTGTNKKFKYNRDEKCVSCKGYGGTEPTDCFTCGGTGVVISVTNTPLGYFRQVGICNSCSGIGTTNTKNCGTCNSTGLQSIEETINIILEPGVKEAMVFVNKGKGHAIKGGNTGDLHVRIAEAKHSIYIRSGNDLKMNLKLTYPQLVLGDKIELNTIDGSKIRITIPEFSDVGNNLKVQNKGLKSYGSDARGDILITITLSVPKELTTEEKEILIKLKELK